MSTDMRGLVFFLPRKANSIDSRRMLHNQDSHIVLGNSIGKSSNKNIVRRCVLFLYKRNDESNVHV